MPQVDFASVLIEFLILVISLTVHEAAHAWSADRLGDPTARLLGRVSLNPAVHTDPIGTILFPLIAIIGNVPVLGWAKPVPVNSLNLRGHWKRKFMLIAAAGPASNLVLATIVALILRALPIAEGTLIGERVAGFAVAAVTMNTLLAVFNMIPIPPLDGGNVLSGLLRGSASRLFDQLRPYGFLILYALMFSGILSRLILPPAYTIAALLLG